MKKDLKKELEKYKNKNHLNWNQVANMIGLSRQGLDFLFKNTSPKTKAITCYRIEQLTGLKSWEYLDGLDNLKKLKSK